MPFRIQRTPIGLNAFFRFFGGETPTELEDRVRGSVDLTDMYGSNLLQVTNDALAAGGINRTVQGISQSQGRLLQMSGTVVMGAAAGTFVKIALLYAPSAAFQLCCVGHTVYTGAGLIAGATLRCAASLTRPIVFQPGALLQVEISGDAAGADHTAFGRHLFESFVIG